MKKKALLLLCLLFILFSDEGKAQLIYVDINNTSSTENGSLQYPYNTIKEGINAAVPGDTVMIKQGTYVPDDNWSGNNHTLFLKAGVTLIGEGQTNTIIDGIIVDQEFSNLHIGVEKLSFDEFHFLRATITGPFDNQNFILNCSTMLISLAFGAGIPVNDTTPGPNHGFLIANSNLGLDGIIEFKQGAGVSNFDISNNVFGYIYLKSGGGYNYVIDDNDIQNGIIDNSGSNTTTISNNRIFDGAIIDRSGGNQYGLEDEIVIHNSIICTENSPILADEDDKSGIIASCRSVSIRNNTISCTGEVSGIHATAGAPFYVTDNTITLDEVLQPNPLPNVGTVGIFNYSGWGIITGNTIYGGGVGYYSKAGTILFVNNVIEKAYTGFYSMGAEEVHHNTIKNCYGDGMILDGLRGPLHNNNITNNAGSGIKVRRMNIDLGGGADTCPGLNVIIGNGNFDLYVETSSSIHPVLYAHYNVWDHGDSTEIMQHDIYDGNDSTGLVIVDCTPIGYLDIPDNYNQDSFSMFPNPVMDKLWIKTPISNSQYIKIELFDITGRRIIILHKGFPTGESIEIDLSTLQPGAYVVRLNYEDGSFIQKIIVYK